MALLLAACLAPAAAAEDDAPWWAAAAPRPEPEYGWWAPPDTDLALSGAPDVSAAPATASAILPSPTQSLPAFAEPRTGPQCDAVTGRCDDTVAAVKLQTGSDATDGGGPAERAPGGGAGTPGPTDTDGDGDSDSDEDAQGSSVPATSATDPSGERDTPNSCRRYERQIVRYLGELEYARERGNEMAAVALEAQIERLAARELKQCPHPPPKNQFAAMMRTLKKLGKLALTAAQYGLF
jgi:hypothetical protein